MYILYFFKCSFKNFVLVFGTYFTILHIVIFTYIFYYMSDKLSVLVLNPFSSKILDKKIEWAWLKKYNLEISWWIKHFMREFWVWKSLQTDEEKLKKLLSWGERSDFLKILKQCCDKNNVIHMVYPMNYFELYFPFLENWNLSNKIFLHLVYDNAEIDLYKIEKIEELVWKNNRLVVASLAQSSSVFNESVDWRELQKWYDEIWFFQIQTSLKASEYLKKCLEEWKDYIDPVSFINSQAIEDWDICIIWELDQEKIASISKVFEVSKDDNKRKKFNNFDIIFITKQLPSLKLFVVKSPYSVYENSVFIQKDNLPTLPEIFSQNEIRLLQLWDKHHLKLLNKYFNDERWVIYDWHKKVRCEDKYNDEWVLAVSSNELILKRFSDEIYNNELFFLSFEDEDLSSVKEYLNTINQFSLGFIIISVTENAVYSNLDFPKKNLSWEILYKTIVEYFWV